MECSNCQGENAETGYVELWDGVCPECGRIVCLREYKKAQRFGKELTFDQQELIWEARREDITPEEWEQIHNEIRGND